MIHLGDITKIDGHRIPAVDIITGGSPCQDLSVAGKRAGLEGERSGLFMEQIRIVKEMRDATANVDIRLVKPRYMVWENVPGAFSSNQGKDFQAVLTEIIRIAEPDAPDVPLPAKWGGGRTLIRQAGQMVSCLASTRCTVLGSPPEKKTHRACRRFCRTQRRRNTL